MDIIVDSSIRLNSSDLPKNVLEEIYNKLRVPNPRKITAEREMLWGAKNLPDYIELWEYNGGSNWLVLPRGFMEDLDKILIDNDIGSNFIDKSFIGKERLFKDIDQIDLRDYQWKAFHELNIQSQGIYKAPTASGKTRTMLEVIRQAGQKTLVICEKTDIAVQWLNTAQNLGFKSVGLAYEKIWEDDKDLVIILRQSLWKRKQSNKQWFDQWGMVVIDECHHCTADTMIDLIQRFSAYYRFGCSATPDADPDLFPIAQAVIGPIVAESTPEEIGDHLVIPSVRVMKTEFEFPYRPTVRAGNKVVRNNYNDMMVALENDQDRNKLIIDCAEKESKKILILSKRKKHLDNLIEIFTDENESGLSPGMGPGIPYGILTGDNSFEIDNIKRRIEVCNAFILFSTLADEGTDIPCLDRLFLAYPGRRLRGFEQAIGRIMRPHPQKKDAMVYDFRDANVSLLNSQFRNRCQNIYHKKNYKVENL